MSLPLAVRKGLIDSLFADEPPGYRAVLRMLVERRELRLLNTIVERLTVLIEQRFDVIVIDVTTVVELDDRLRESIQRKYAAQLGTSVALREHIDADIKGGIIMELRGRRIDASLNTQLVRARAVLAKDTFGGFN
jgi:F-type H+-transporting ATPase subunit delta